MEMKHWKGLLVLGIILHILAAMLMPLGLDAHVHATYVSDEMDDGEGHLEWGELRQDSPSGSTISEVPADDKWFAWHTVMQIWFTIFSISTTSLHLLGLIGGLSCLAVIFYCTRDLFGIDNSIKLTALASIYPPLIRATGRVYQESIILLLVTISAYAVIKGLRDEKKVSPWFFIPVGIVLVIISFKGMPLWYFLPAIVALVLAKRMKMNPIQFLLIAILGQFLVMNRNGISYGNENVLPALITACIAYFLYVKCGMLLFRQPDGDENKHSESLSKGSTMIGALLVGWIAALWVTEAVALEKDFTDIIRSFRHNGRYLSLLLIPIWYSVMLRSEAKGINFPSKSKNIAVVFISLLLIVNITLLGMTGERGTDVIGQHLEDEINSEEDILFISDSPLSMHRLYSIKFSMDPDSDGQNNGFWRTSESLWQSELLECSHFENVNWIIKYHTGDEIKIDGWVEVDFEGSDKVSENYRLYTWGGNSERCA